MTPPASFIWHPYTRFSSLQQGLPKIVRGEGLYLYDTDGQRYFDAVSSWWSCQLGHSHPRVVSAIQEQAGKLQHSILGNLTHPGAEELARRLAHLMPTPDRHVMFASDGASAVEAALKIVLQYAHQTGQPQRTRFVSLKEAYHGDTLGAVGVGYLEEFHHLLRPVLKEAWRLDIPPCNGCRGTDCAATCYDGVDAFLTARADEIAGGIVEPLCLGATGMKMYGPGYLRRLAETCRRLQIPLISDEIAMGFGRTGRMFAFEHAGIDPDLVCLGKGLTAGYVPMSAVVVRDDLYRTFSDQPVDHTFYHGHTWCGNPIAAAAALAALDVYEADGLAEHAAELEHVLVEEWVSLRGTPGIRDIRHLGLIGVIELEPGAGPVPAARRVQYAMRDRGYLLRSLGNVIYLMPPLIITADECRQAARDLADEVQRKLESRPNVVGNSF